jgi:RHS repeat-associated protein
LPITRFWYGNSVYAHADQLGSIRALTDGSGTVVNTADYDAYGQPTSMSESVANPFGYAGEYTDAETGFLYLRARYYDPATQQFLTVDPLLALTGQAYNYAEGSPVNFTDPSGLWIESALDLAFLALDLGDVACNGLGAENGLSLAADLLGLALPGVTGLGLGVRFLSHMGEGGRLALHGGETLYRGGSKPESLARLSQKAQESLEELGVHGVSVSANKGSLARYGNNISSAGRSEVETHFNVHNTGSHNHRTIELPNPLTQEHVDLFNRLFGR